MNKSEKLLKKVIHIDVILDKMLSPMEEKTLKKTIENKLPKGAKISISQNDVDLTPTETKKS